MRLSTASQRRARPPERARVAQGISGIPPVSRSAPHHEKPWGDPGAFHRFALRQPAARASDSLQNQRSPFAGLIRVRS